MNNFFWSLIQVNLFINIQTFKNVISFTYNFQKWIFSTSKSKSISYWSIQKTIVFVIKNERIEKQFRSNQKLNCNDEIIVDFDDFLKSKRISVQYNEIFIVNFVKYFETIDTIVKQISIMSIKMILINISNWKSKIHIFFHMRMKHDVSNSKKNVRIFIDFYEAHVFLNKNVIHAIKTKKITSTINLSNIQQKIYFQNNLSQNLMQMMNISFNFKHFVKFNFEYNDVFSVLEQMRSLMNQNFFDVIVRFVMSFNKLIEIKMTKFLIILQINVFDYFHFYFSHSKSHFLRFENYSNVENRSTVKIFVSFILNFWFEYNIVYNYAIIYEHEIFVEARQQLQKNDMKFRMMNVLNFDDKFYIEFLKKSNELNVRMKIENVLKINFDLNIRINENSWTTIMIKFLFCAFLNDVCVSLFRKFYKNNDIYDER